MKKLVLAVVLGYVWLMLTNFLVHGVWLMSQYAAIPDSWRPMAQMHRKFWIMWVGQLIFAAMFAYIYKRGAEKKPWPGQGLRYGILATFFTVIPYSLSEYVIYRVPYMLAVKWMCAGAVQLIVMGLIVAAILQESPS